MSDENKIRVKALRPFEGVEGYKDEASVAFEVSRARYAELKANGLVEAEGNEPDEKKAPEPANKRAPEPQNKAR